MSIDATIPRLPVDEAPPKKQKTNGAWALKPGFAWNPLRGLPRNMSCPCGSGKKFKACHLETLPRVVKKELADKYREGLKHPELVHFINDEEKPAVETEVAKDA